MAVPAFTFTERAVPIVQMGRFPHAFRGKDRWGRDHWGTARWGRNPLLRYDPVWAEVTCEVHEVTTDTGRASASDRFEPGTAAIIASNVTGWGDAEVPLTEPNFVDDFERPGPQLGSSWDTWPEMVALRPATEPLVITEAEATETRAATVQKHPTATGTSTPPLVVRATYKAEASSPTLTIGPFPAAVAGDVVFLSLVMEGRSIDLEVPDWEHVGDMAGALDEFSPYLFRHRITTEEAATDEPWVAEAPSRWNYVAWVVGGVGEPEQQWLPWLTGGMTGSFETRVSDEPSTGAGLPMPATGCVVARLMMSLPTRTLGTLPAPLVDVAQTSTSPDWGFTQHLVFDGGTTAPTHYAAGATAAPTMVPFTPTAAVFGHTASVVVIPGSTYTPESLPYEGAGAAKWMLTYEGDHFLEAAVTGLAAPERVWPDARFLIELAVHLGATDLSSQVAGFEWVPDWDDPATTTGTLSWWMRRRAADGSWAGAVLASGTLAIGPAGFPEVAVFRFEADAPNPAVDPDGPGTLRALYQGVVLGTVTDPTPPTGRHVAIYADYETGSLSYGRTVQPGPIRFEEVQGGAHIASPIYLEPATLIRIGVWHTRYDFCWFFRGYVDALRPIYDPERDDTVRIECIDALGEVGRLRVRDAQADELEATDRVTHILNEAEWPLALRSLDDDATIMSPQPNADERVVDLLTQVAESCGGAVYGGPDDGDLVFRRKDWQGYDPADDPVDGYITNFLGVETDGPVVCPSGWERSWDRQDMTTRVTYTNQEGDEIVYRNSDAERRWGIEEYTRSLVTVYRHDLELLAQRQLRLRGPEKFPRVEAVLLDAETGDSALDMMAISTFTRPHNYRCQLRRSASFVFNERMLVTGLRHVFSADRWQLRMALDLAAPFIAEGGRWGDEDRPLARSGRWGRDTWGHAR